MSMFDHHDPDYSADRIYEAADRLTKQAKESPPGLIAVDGVTRYVCPEGCGSFDSMIERALHVITEHGKDAA